METNQAGGLAVVAISRRADVIRAIDAAAAAASVRLTVLDQGDDIRAAWSRAATILVGSDMTEIAGWGLAPRQRVYLVGLEPAEDLWRWSVPLSASVIVLPAGASWLAQAVAGGLGRAGGEVIVVHGGSGGVGGSTLAVGVALAAARRGRTVALVDGDAAGGGLDLVLGAEAAKGWRWPKLADASGRLADIADMLPEVDGVRLLSWGRGEVSLLAQPARASVVDVLARHHDLVIIDAGRGDASDWSGLAARALLVVAATVRGVAAARFALTVGRATGLAVLRTGRIPPADIGRSLGLPLVAAVPRLRQLPVLADEGLPPPVGGAWGKACQAVVAWACHEEVKNGRRRAD